MLSPRERDLGNGGRGDGRRGQPVRGPRRVRPGAPWLGALALSSAAIALLASVPRSPVLPALPPASRAPAPLAAIARALGWDALSPGVATVGAVLLVALALVAFAGILLTAWHGGVSPRAVLWTSAGLLAVITVVPPLFSRDVHSYAIYGRMWAVHGADPYTVVPAEFPEDPFREVISPQWDRSPSVYGPAFTLLSGGIVGVFGSVEGTLLAFKVIAAAAVLGSAVLAARLGRDRGRAAFAAAVVGLNPVVLFHTAGGGHNDALIGLAAVGALSLWPWSTLAATAVLALGALVKATGAIPLVLGLAAVTLATPAGRRLRALGAHAALALALVVLAFAPFGVSTGTVEAFADLASRTGWASPVRLLARGVEGVLPGTAGDVGATVVRVAFLALAGAVLVLIARRLRPDGPGLADGWSWGLLVFALCAAYLLPWYVAWFLPLLALSTRTVPILAGLALSGLLALTGIPAEPSFAPGTWSAMLFAVRYVGAPLALGILVVLLRDLRGVLLAGAPPRLGG